MTFSGEANPVSDSFDYQIIACPTCDVNDTRTLGARGGSAHRAAAGEQCTIVQCRRCDLIYANPFPFPRDLDALYSNEESYFQHHDPIPEKIERRKELVTRMAGFTRGRRLLDVGAGQGETVAAALSLGWDAWGVESSARFAREAEKSCPGRVIHGELESGHASLPDGSFDVVILAAVMEHFHHPTRVLEAVARALRPGGVLFVDVPNEAGLYFMVGNLWQRLQRRNWVVNLAPTFSPYHVFGFSRGSLTAMLAKYQLTPVDLRFYGGQSLVAFAPTPRRALEWLGSHAIHELSKLGELGTYIECVARKRSA